MSKLSGGNSDFVCILLVVVVAMVLMATLLLSLSGREESIDAKPVIIRLIAEQDDVKVYIFRSGNSNLYFTNKGGITR